MSKATIALVTPIAASSSAAQRGAGSLDTVMADHLSTLGVG
jgi:hypothetical protein